MFYKSRNTQPTSIKRRLAVFASAGVTALALLGAPGSASAAPQLPVNGSSDMGNIEAELRELGSSNDAAARDSAWQTRQNLHSQAENLPPQAAQAAKQTVDGAVNTVFPGLIAARTAPAPAPAPVPAPAPAPAPAFNSGSCPAEAEVCVDLNGGRSWLQENGQVVYGAVPVSSGAVGRNTQTPRGTFYVNRKVKDEISYEFNNAPMPYAIYFTNNGHAFHQGNVATTSAGCIRLGHADAVHYFNNLQIGDMVYIY